MTLGPRARLAIVAAPVVAAAWWFAGCSGDDTATGGVAVVDAWIRPTPPVTNVGAFYLTVSNGTDRPQRIVGAASPRCAEIEIHRTSTVDGVATMAPAQPADLEIGPGEALVLEPSNLHVMCLGLTEPVVEGERIPLVIELAEAGERSVEAVATSR